MANKLYLIFNVATHGLVNIACSECKEQVNNVNQLQEINY